MAYVEYHKTFDVQEYDSNIFTSWACEYENGGEAASNQDYALHMAYMIWLKNYLFVGQIIHDLYHWIC